MKNVLVSILTVLSGALAAQEVPEDSIPVSYQSDGAVVVTDGGNVITLVDGGKLENFYEITVVEAEYIQIDLEERTLFARGLKPADWKLAPVIKLGAGESTGKVMVLKYSFGEQPVITFLE